MMKRMAAVLLALLLLAVASAGLCESYNETDALDEEDGANVFSVEPGTYEWYMIPADIEDDHAYLDIYPNEETVQRFGSVWSYTFTLEEVGGVDFFPQMLTLIGFSDGVEISRIVYMESDFAAWWAGMIPADSLVTYTGSEHNPVLDALAISVIGEDAAGYEMEFHSMVYLAQ